MTSGLDELKKLLGSKEGPGIIRIEASAGAGKTYTLTLCFLITLGMLPVSISSLRSILAITFTNRAAEEMKERVISMLKTIALFGDSRPTEARYLSEVTGLDASMANKWMEFILRHYSSLGITTIDSFIFQILKSIAFEHGIRPDLTVETDTNWIINLAFDELLFGSQWDESTKELLLACVETFLFVQAKSGFFVEKEIKKMMSSLQEQVRHELLGERVERVDPKGLDLSRLAFERACMDLKRHMESLGIELSVAGWKKQLERPKGNINKAIFEKKSLSEVVKKACLSLLNPELEACYRTVIDLRDSYLYQEAINKVAPYTELFWRLNKEMRKIMDRLGLIPMGSWLDLCSKYVSSGSLAGIYAILGEKIRYILIDEFQDTSSIQWNVILPVVENALSEGGKLVYVGDPKQSIYMWRGADPTIFLKVAQDLNQEEVVLQLKSNYRSDHCIVEFNNSFYTCVSKDYRDLFVDSLLGPSNNDEILDKNRKLLAELISAFYGDVKQESIYPPKLCGGRCVFPVILDKDAEVQLLEELKCAILREIENGRQFKDIAILSRKNEDAEEVSNFLWANGFPCITKNSLKLRVSSVVNGLKNLLRYLSNPLNDTALLRFLGCGIFQDIVQEEFFEKIALAKEKNILSIVKKNYPDIGKEIEKLLSYRNTDTPYSITSYVIRKYNLFERYPEHLPFILRYLDILFYIEEMGFVSIEEILSRLEASEERIGGGEEIDAIKVLTIHESKGLEFPVVMLVYCNWDAGRYSILPLENGTVAYVKQPYPKRVKEKLYELKCYSALEALNMLYVSTTRAKEALYLFVVPKGSRSVADIIKRYVEDHERYFDC